MLRTLSLVALLFFLAACAGNRNAVTKCGDGVYVASGSPDHPFGNYIKTARNVAFARAETFCHSKGRLVSVESVGEGLPARVTFRCLKEGDPGIKQSPLSPSGMNKDPCRSPG